MSITVAHASGSDLCVLLFRVFRVRPWLILLLMSFHPSVANLLPL